MMVGADKSDVVMWNDDLIPQTKAQKGSCLKGVTVRRSKFRCVWNRADRYTRATDCSKDTYPEAKVET